MSGLMVTVPAGRRQYQTRTAGGAYLYRVIQYYDAWPFGHDSRSPYGSKSRRRRPSGRWSRSAGGWRVPTATRSISAAAAGTGRRSLPWPSS